jgi:hypothetical protein
LDKLLDQLLGALGLIDYHSWFVPFVLLPIMLAVAGWLHWRAERRTRPFVAVAKSRAEQLAAAIGDGPDPTAERSAFARSYLTIAQAMGAKAKGADALVQAWREFQETIVTRTATRSAIRMATGRYGARRARRCASAGSRHVRWMGHAGRGTRAPGLPPSRRVMHSWICLVALGAGCAPATSRCGHRRCTVSAMGPLGGPGRLGSARFPASGI